MLSRFRESAIGEFLGHAGPWALALIPGPLIGLADLIGAAIEGEQKWDPPVVWVYVAWVLGVVVATFAAFARMRNERDEARDAVQVMKGSRAELTLYPRFGLSKEPHDMRTIAEYYDPEGARELRDEIREAAVSYLIVGVVNSPRSMNPAAVATNAEAIAIFEAIDGDELRRVFEEPVHLRWVDSPRLAPGEPTSSARYKDLNPSRTAVYWLVVGRETQHGFFAGAEGSYFVKGEDSTAIDPRFRLDGAAYRVTLEVSAANTDANLVQQFQLINTPELRGLALWDDGAQPDG
ncbi:MAG: hypothetical protein WD652_04250 [Acidimicrobiia bacterium]